MSSPKSIFTAPASPKTSSTAFSEIANLNGTHIDPGNTGHTSYFALPASYSAPGEQRTPPRPIKSTPGRNGADGGRTINHSIITPQDPRARSVSDPEALSLSPTESRSQNPPRSLPRSTVAKRSFDEETTDQATKRPRLRPKRKHFLDHFSFSGPSINTTQPPSPLFFSHNSHLRPQLPPRFSSSEAAARMLSKAKVEDSHIKTVSLARGTVSTPFVGPGGLPVRASSERSSAARSASPDSSSVRGDTSFGTISSIGVVELLEQDERPTLIIDLGDSANYGPGELRPIFTNSSLRSYPGLLESVSGYRDDGHSEAADQRSFIEFKAWVLSAAVNGESLNVCLPSFQFSSLSWSCSTLRKRFRLVSGSFLPDSFSPRPASIKTPQMPSIVAEALKGSQQLPVRGDEPPDYFGNAAPPRPTAPSTKSQDVIPTTEAPSKASYRAPSHTPLSVGALAPPTASSSDLVSLDDIQTISAPSFDWTRIPVTDAMPPHIRFARSVDWASTALGPIEHWCADLRQMCNLIMASPHPAAMYWGDDLIAIYNEAYIMLAGQKHPTLMGQSYREAWKEIWDEVRDVFASAKLTGEATMKDDDRLFMWRSDYLEETYFSWSIIPMVGSDGTVVGLYNPAFEKTRRKIAERRMLTLREVGERTAAARDVRGFWEQVLAALEINEYDTPFVLLYSVSDDSDSDSSSIHSINMQGSMNCRLEGSVGVPEDHPSAPYMIDLKSSTEGFAQVFQQVLKTDRPVHLEAGSEGLPSSLLEGLEPRGFGDDCKAVVVCPIHPTTGESVLGFLVLGVNPRRPYDEDYSLFLQLLTRQLATSLASVVLFEEEIRRGQRAAKLAALDRMELSEQLAARTQEAIESETKFTRMAEFAPVGMFIANSEGMITYCNDTWYETTRISRNIPVQKWMEYIYDEDRQSVSNLWHELVVEKNSITTAFRFKEPWYNADGTTGERWVLFSAYPEKHPNGKLKSVFGSFTDISKQKWAEGFQKRKMEEAVELKRQQENFIDMTSHEMRNPLSAILQCADEISTTITDMREGKTQGLNLTPELDNSLSSAVEAAQTIALCAQHQKRIVDDILTLSKLDSELLLVTPVDAQPLTVVQRALKMHEGELSSNDIKLEFVVDKSYTDLGIDWVRFDPSRVLQVLINLTTNAIKFTTTESKRTITVSIAASNERPTSSVANVDYFPSRRGERPNAEAEWGDGEPVYIQYGVQDTGRGLTEQEKKMLFLRFSQASPRTHVQYGGSGLGLFISRQLTELQGGEIGVASEAGKGSTFAFYVRARRSHGPDKNANGAVAPVGDVVAAEAKKSLTAPVKKAIGTKYILLVEDNLVNQRVLQKQLKNLGCVVQVANHGGEALDRLRQSSWSTIPGGKKQQLSVVLMDQEMPVMDGLTATKKIREMEKLGELKGRVPVIAVTANARSEQIQTALDVGMDDVVSKPFRIPDLIPKIEELMGKNPEPGLES